MNFIKSIIVFVKKLFNKQEEIKTIEEPKQNLNKENNMNFIESLKVNIVEKRKKKKVETLVCNGDGLGIQKKISY